MKIFNIYTSVYFIFSFLNLFHGWWVNEMYGVHSHTTEQIVMIIFSFIEVNYSKFKQWLYGKAFQNIQTTEISSDFAKPKVVMKIFIQVNKIEVFNSWFSFGVLNCEDWQNMYENIISVCKVIRMGTSSINIFWFPVFAVFIWFCHIFMSEIKWRV